MNFKKQTIYSILASTMVLAMTACGGGGSSKGTSTSPEEILEKPLVKEALKAAKEHGVDVRTDLGHNPPDLTGYYRNYVGGIAVATESGRDIGRNYVPSEKRVETKGESYDEVEVAHDNFEPIFYSSSKGAMLRGDGNHFTIYSEYKKTCTEAGSNFTRFGITIESATRDPQSGAIVDRNYVRVVSNTSGTLTSACDERIVGGGKNKWTVGRLPSLNKVAHASDLNYMCVDDNKAYIPKETWKNSDGQSCKCTTDYEVECK